MVHSENIAKVNKKREITWIGDMLLNAISLADNLSLRQPQLWSLSIPPHKHILLTGPPSIIPPLRHSKLPHPHHAHAETNIHFN